MKSLCGEAPKKDTTFNFLLSCAVPVKHSLSNSQPSYDCLDLEDGTKIS